MANIDTTTDMATISDSFTGANVAGHRFMMSSAVAMQNTNPPQNPSHDFLGDMRGNNG